MNILPYYASREAIWEVSRDIGLPGLLKVSALAVLCLLLSGCFIDEQKDYRQDVSDLSEALALYRKAQGQVPVHNNQAAQLYAETMYYVRKEYLYPIDEEALRDKFMDSLGETVETPRDVNDQQLVEESVRVMLETLDPYSTYFTPKAFASFNEETSGEFGGLGVEVRRHDLGVEVVAPIRDTPAAEAGLKSRDIITHANSLELRALSFNEMIQNLRGPPSSMVEIEVLRPTLSSEDLSAATLDRSDGARQGESGSDVSEQAEILKQIEETSEKLQFSLRREVIEVESVHGELLDAVYRKNQDASLEEANPILYIHISHFNDRTGDEFEDVLDDLREEAGPDFAGLILDLRNNPGGVFDQALSVSDALLGKGEIVSTRTRDSRDSFSSDQKGLKDSADIIVLINEGSASASEIVAGALRDHQRAQLVGHKTYGKGVVQTLYSLREGGGIKLTTAEYLTPSGSSVGDGIEPDVESQDDPDTDIDEVIQLATNLIDYHARPLATR